MSELTRCNHCTLRDLRAHAKQTGRVVTLLPDTALAGGNIRGTVVLIHGSDEAPDPERHWAAWFWAITPTCACHD